MARQADRIDRVEAGVGAERPMSLTFRSKQVRDLRFSRQSRRVTDPARAKVSSIGQSAPHRRRDVADVQDLIRARDLPEELAETLDASVCDFYRQVWAEAQEADRVQEEGD